jgi:uncharacterized protein involved in type VI secretion and phage assembly
VRVLQSTAGPGFGAFFLPRIGQKVPVREAGVDPKVSAVVYVAARAPDAGEDYTALAKKFPTPPASAGRRLRRRHRTGRANLSHRVPDQAFWNPHDRRC